MDSITAMTVQSFFLPLFTSLKLLQKYFRASCLQNEDFNQLKLDFIYWKATSFPPRLNTAQMSPGEPTSKNWPIKFISPSHRLGLENSNLCQKLAK